MDNKHKLSYIDTNGDNEIIVFVHGIMMSYYIWIRQIEYFSKKYRVVAPDLYGFGFSHGVADRNRYEDHAEDLKCLLDNLNIKNIYLVGWSLGGGVAIKFTSLFPDYVKKMVLVGTTPQLIASDDFEHGMQQYRADQLFNLLESDYDSGINEFINMQIPESDDNGAHKILYEIVSKTDQKIALAQLLSTGNIDLRGDIKKIKIPTLIISGELDNVCSMDAGKYMSELISDSKFLCMKQSGHTSFLTSPDEFNLNVECFLN